MKICAVIPSYLPHFGGAEVGVHEVFKHLAENTEHTFSVVTTTLDDQLAKFEVIDKVLVYRYKRTKRWARWYAPTLQAFIPVMDLLMKIRPDVLLITYMLPVGLAACLAARFLKIPVVMALGGNDIFDPFHMPDRLLQRISGLFIKHNHHLLVWSNWAKDWIVKQHRIPASRIKVVPFAVNTQFFHPALEAQPIRQRYRIPDDTILLFALQRLEIRKGVDILIKAFSQVLSTCSEQKLVLLIGGKGKDYISLKLLVSQLGLDENVIFSGFIPEEEKPLFYAACDIFVLHSYHEGLGIVLEEAAATGTPQISTNAGGTSDVVSIGETGLLVQPGSVDEFAAAICSLVTAPELMKQMGVKAYQKVQQTFSIELVASQYLNVFEAAFNTG